MGNTPSHCCFFSRDGQGEKNGKRSNLTYATADYYSKRPTSTSPGAQYMVRNDEMNGMQDSAASQKNNLNVNSLQHMSEREPEEPFEDPSGDPHVQTIFLWKFNDLAERDRRISRRQSCLGTTHHNIVNDTVNSNLHKSKKFNSCSTIYIDDSTVSQPNLKNTIKCVALAVYYHIRNRNSASDHNHEVTMALEIFNEKLHPLTDDYLPDDYGTKDPDHRVIYRFLRLLFSSAQLTAEVAIITLIYLERLLYYGEIEINPIRWKRMVLGAVLLASKVWDDQAVWNVDYCGILSKLQVQDMNELERQYLEMIQFNINVPSGVYAKYYFDLRTLADKNEFFFPVEPLDKNRAAKLEATSRICENKLKQAPLGKKSTSLENLKKANRLSTIVIS